MECYEGNVSCVPLQHRGRVAKYIACRRGAVADTRKIAQSPTPALIDDADGGFADERSVAVLAREGRQPVTQRAAGTGGLDHGVSSR